MRLVCIFLFIASLAPDARAWSNKEHMLLTRIAARRLVEDPATPPAMREWLKRNAGTELSVDAEREFLLHQRIGLFPRGADGLAFWSTMPDMAALADRQERKIEPYGVNEGKLHYIDIELFMADASLRKYAHDLSHKPKLSDIPRDMNDERFKSAGMLPFAVEHTYGLLVRSMKSGRLEDRPGVYPRDAHAVKWAGWLAHYVEDNTQPHHATEDYKSRSYFPDAPDPRRAPDVHSDMEYRLVDDEDQDYPQLRQELWDALTRELDQVRDPVQTDDLWRATIEVSLSSYDALPVIGQAGREAYGGLAGQGRFQADVFFHHKGQYLGREMSIIEIKAHQLAWAVARVQKIWLRAWKDGAGRP